MNYIEQFADMLGVEVGEKFDILIENGNKSELGPYVITEYGFFNRNGRDVGDYVYCYLICGKWRVQKLPWKPKKGEMYFSVLADGTITGIEFCLNASGDLLDYKVGNFFRTWKEAEKNKDKIVAMYDEIKEELA